MLTALNLVVGLIVVAIGANLIGTSKEMAGDEQQLLATPRSWVPVRAWSHRFGGVFLIGIGISICLDPLF